MAGELQRGSLTETPAENLHATLLATMEVVAAQRAQLDDLYAELASARAAEGELRIDVSRERAAREVAEERLREASVDFARRLAAMQARVLEAERDVVLGGQVLIARGPTHSPPSTGGSGAVASGSTAPSPPLHPSIGGSGRSGHAEELQCGGHTPGGRCAKPAVCEMSSRPPLAPHQQDVGSLAGGQIVHACLGRKQSNVGANRRAFSAHQRLEPL
mmetsp:Transcript_34492/g.94964  ORF Transcript_34492/g.94964 Transcript_34492/m.94964 type:complete len:217 (-) Transcript_34492:167-817(-)